MDLIYMNSEKEDIGVLKDYKFDLAFGTDENDFECTVNITNHVCKSGYYLYYEGTEYGGIIDSIKVNTDADEIKYIGRTWHGMLESHILQPDENQDYLVMSGEANSVLASLIARIGVGSLFKASTEESGINISGYKMNRYVGAYEGMRKMLKAYGGKLNISFKDGFVELSAKPLVDYSQDEQFDTDQIDFDIQKNYKPLNHVICLGKGDLKDRRVIHVYADASGNISGTKTFAGLDEVCAVYDNSNAESDDELKQGGIDMIQDSWASMSVDFSFETDNESIDVGDVIGAKERITEIVVVAMISKKIVSISNNTTSISYACEGNTGMVSSGSYDTSGSGNVIVIDTELSKTSENPVQNKVVTNALEGKQDAITAINTSNIGSQSVNYANSAGSAVRIGGCEVQNVAGANKNYYLGSDGGSNPIQWIPRSNMKVGYADSAGSAVDQTARNTANNLGTISQGTATLNTSNTSGGSAYWLKVGHVAIVYIYDVKMKSGLGQSQTDVICSGLPKAKKYFGVFRTSGSGQIIRVGMATGSSNLCFWWLKVPGTSYTDNYSFEIAYICE